jgi:hypothetical protein
MGMRRPGGTADRNFTGCGGIERQAAPTTAGAAGAGAGAEAEAEAGATNQLGAFRRSIDRAFYV